MQLVAKDAYFREEEGLRAAWLNLDREILWHPLIALAVVPRIDGSTRHGRKAPSNEKTEME